MDKSWMDNGNKASKQYMAGVNAFLQFAESRLGRTENIRCPCRDCLNTKKISLREIDVHLFVYGISRIYKNWIHHGENPHYNQNVFGNIEESSSRFATRTHDNSVNQDLQGLLSDLGNAIEDDEQHYGNDDNVTGAEDETVHDDRYNHLVDEAQQELYPGCAKMSKLSFVVMLLHLKVLNHWSNKSCTMLLEFLKDVLPEGANIPKTYNEAKKMLQDLGLGYESIHACKYDCLLFWKEHEKDDLCTVCGESRWKIDDGKGKKIPHKVLRYFPITPRLQRLYFSKHTAEAMRWHKEKRPQVDGILKHPTDSIAWKDFDKQFNWFASDPRNVRLGLATDGFNPFGTMSISYSIWPVIIIPYNLPPWKCMKDPFFMLSLLIPGPKAPGKEIDIYMQPLIKELIDLWENGVLTFDAFSQQRFIMHAAVLWTINDFPAYGNLSGWVTKGYMACPVCAEHTCSSSLRSKISYMGHRRYLHTDHPWRNSKKFNGKKEDKVVPKPHSGEEMLAQLNSLIGVMLTKHDDLKNKKRISKDFNWCKKSIFFDLPYWCKLSIRHNLDVMHIEKNICDSIIGTIMNIEGKSKDTHKARMDLKDMKIRKELHLQSRGTKLFKPRAIFTLTPKEKSSFCEFLKTTKFPDGYAANISRSVRVNDNSITGLKSHDCHVMIQRLLPIGLHGLMDRDVVVVLSELARFFRILCARTLDSKDLKKLGEDIITILCKMELIFPPAFFDVMVHLAVHLPREAEICGPVSYRWMYPIERNLGRLKRYVRNKARPEGSIAEAYIANEALTFCSMYLSGVETTFTRGERNIDYIPDCGNISLSIFLQRVRPIGAYDYHFMDPEEYRMAQWYILYNCEEVSPFLLEHINELGEECSNNINQRQQKLFPKWFENKIQAMREERSQDISDDLYYLSCWPDRRVKSYSGCIANGVRFHTIERDSRHKTQNSGVVVDGDDDSHMTRFYGTLQEIIELTYGGRRKVYLFKCKWYDTSRKKCGIREDLDIVSIRVTNMWYENDPFIFASQAQQVFYLMDTKWGEDWRVVQTSSSRHLWDFPDNEVDREEIDNDAHNDDNIAFQITSSYEDSLPRVIRESIPTMLNRAEIEMEDISSVEFNIDEMNTEANINDIEIVGEENDDDTIAEYCDESEHNDTIAKYNYDESDQE